MRLSYVIRSHTSAESLGKTLAALPTVTPLPPMLWETRVVLGAPVDGVSSMLAVEFPRVSTVEQRDGTETAALEKAVAESKGEFVIVLDAESHPMDHRSVSTALARLDREPSLAAVAGRISIAGGTVEEPLLPTVLVRGANCFRRAVLMEMPKYAASFTSESEMLELGFRMWNAGYAIERSPDTLIEQNAPEISQDEGADYRDHLILTQRFFPPHLRQAYWDDWKLRFDAFAKYQGTRKAAWKAIWSARRSIYRAKKQGRTTLNDRAIEGIFEMRRQAALIGSWARENAVWRVVIGDFSGNLYATYNACRSVGLQIRCIVDNNPAFEGIEYRGLPVVPASCPAFEGGGIEGAVVSSSFAWQAEPRARSLRSQFRGSILKICDGSQIAARINRASAA